MNYSKRTISFRKIRWVSDKIVKKGVYFSMNNENGIKIITAIRNIQIVFIIVCLLSMILSFQVDLQILLLLNYVHFVIIFIIDYYVILHDSYFYLHAAKVKPLFGKGVSVLLTPCGLTGCSFDMSYVCHVMLFWAFAFLSVFVNCARFFISTVICNSIIFSFTVLPLSICYFLSDLTRTLKDNEIISNYLCLLFLGSTFFIPLFALFWDSIWRL